MKTIRQLALCAVIISLAAASTADNVYFGTPADGSSHFSSTRRNASTPVPGPSAGIAPFAFSIVPPAQFPSEDWDIYGLRINLFVGHHRDVAFVDVGLLGNDVAGNLLGVECAGLFNRVGSSNGAVQLAGLFNYVERDFCGLQGSFMVNSVDGDMVGLEVAAVNLAQDMTGIQIGLFNRAERASGLQIGVANYAYQMQGLQIGLFNVIADSNIPFLPILNAAF